MRKFPIIRLLLIRGMPPWRVPPGIDHIQWMGRRLGTPWKWKAPLERGRRNRTECMNEHETLLCRLQLSSFQQRLIEIARRLVEIF